MKKVTIFALALLLLSGVVALASDDVPTDADFTIPNDYDFSYSGNLDFPAGTPAVTDPGATGWFETNSLSITFSTNYNLTIGLQQGQFHGPKTLPTEAGGTGMFVGWLDQWKTVPSVTKTWIATKAFGPGVYTGDFSLRVQRNGYNDPSGTYTSDCFIMVFTD